MCGRAAKQEPETGFGGLGRLGIEHEEMKFVLGKEEVSGFAIGNNQGSDPSVLEGLPGHNTFQKLLMLHYIMAQVRKRRVAFLYQNWINYFECRGACTSSRVSHDHWSQ